MSHLPTRKEIIVRNASDLSGTLSSTVVYLVDGVIDMGTTSITVPSTGLNILGLGFGISSLTSTENNYTMFVDTGTAGNLFLSDLEITTSGTSSKVFDLDNQGNGAAMDANTVNFNSCTSLGELDEYRQLLMRNIGVFSCTDGLTLIGNWIGGARIETTLIRNFGSGTFIKAGTGLVINTRFLSDTNMDGQTNAQFSNISAANIATDGGFELINANFNGVTNPLPNIIGSSVKARFRNNQGLRNTYVGARWVITGETTTTIAGANTPVKLAGTTTYADEQWFSHSTNNAFVYDSTNRIEVKVSGNISLTGGTGDQINAIVRQYDSSAAGYVDLEESGTVTMNASGRAENISFIAFAILDENDRIEIWIENKTDADDVTALLKGVVSVEERAS